MLFHFLSAILGSNWLEQSASVIALAGIVLTVMRRSFSWILDIISSLMYGAVFYGAGFYSDSLLQLLFIAMSVYGWLSWTSIRAGKPVLSIRKIKQQELIITLAVIFVLTLGGGFFFSHFVRGAAYPYADSLCTAISVAATWLTARKIIQNWYLWIVADLIYIWLFCLKHLYPTAILYSVLVVLAITGLISWKKIETATL